jgi:hypothetical protein
VGKIAAAAERVEGLRSAILPTLQEAFMCKWISAALASAVLVLTTLPAHAAWRTYVNSELGISFMAPGEIKAEIGNFRGALSGPHQTIVYRCITDNIEYKVTVISFRQAQAEGATILGEREYMFQDGKKALIDTFSRVGSGMNTVYGRKLAVELPGNKGRTMGAFYFTKGRLIALEATELAAKGDVASANAQRFIDSISFAVGNSEPGAVKLDTPKLQ